MTRLSQVKSHQCCDSPRCPRGNGVHRLKRSPAVGHGVLLQGRPAEGEAGGKTASCCYVKNPARLGASELGRYTDPPQNGQNCVAVFQMLSKPENCCGLKESEVLSLLNDVGTSRVCSLCAVFIQTSLSGPRR